MQHNQYGVGVQLSMGKQDRFMSVHYLQAQTFLPWSYFKKWMNIFFTKVKAVFPENKHNQITSKMRSSRHFNKLNGIVSNNMCC